MDYTNHHKTKLWWLKNTQIRQYSSNIFHSQTSKINGVVLIELCWYRVWNLYLSLVYLRNCVGSPWDTSGTLGSKKQSENHHIVYFYDYGIYDLIFIHLFIVLKKHFRIVRWFSMAKNNHFTTVLGNNRMNTIQCLILRNLIFYSK